MSKYDFFLSLTTSNNDYQKEQAARAEEAARQLGVGLEITYAEGDAVRQSGDLLRAVKSGRFQGVLFEPVSSSLRQVADSAVEAKVAFVVLNRQAEYLRELRQLGRAPVFSVTTDHAEVGRIQGRQLAALLPRGGVALLVQGPTGNEAADLRTAGLNETKPPSLQLRQLRGQWTRESGNQALRTWLGMSSTRNALVDAVVAQNDAMAVGAREAVTEAVIGEARERWRRLPFLGADGLPTTGRVWLRDGLLQATVVIPANTGQALEALCTALDRGSVPDECQRSVPRSLPALEGLARA